MTTETKDTVDVDRWIDRHVGWHFVLLLIGIVGGFFLGLVHAQSNANERIRRLNVEFNDSLESASKQRQELQDKRHAAELEAVKLRGAYETCGRRAAEWERRAREKGE